MLASVLFLSTVCGNYERREERAKKHQKKQTKKTIKEKGGEDREENEMLSAITSR